MSSASVRADHPSPKGAVLRRIRDSVGARPGRATLRRDVLRLALPAMAEQMLAMTVGIVDTYLVGHLGAAPLAAVGLAIQWVFLAQTFFGAISTGSTALIARFVGAREPENAQRVLQQSVLVGAVIGLAATMLGMGLAGPAVRLLGAPPDVVGFSTAYLRVAAISFMLATLMFVGNAALRGAGDTRTPLYVMLGVNALNIAVAWTFINGAFGLPKLGVVGSAVGAAAAQGIGGLAVVAILLRGKAGIRLDLRPLRLDWDLVRRILRVGIPTGLEQLLFRTGNMVFARILASLGTMAYAANQVAINGWSLAFMPGFGFAVAATTLVGQSLGAQDPNLAEKRGYISYWLGAALMGLIGLTFLAFPGQIVAFFTEDPQVIALGTTPLRMVGAVQPLSAASMIFSGALRGAGDTRAPMVVTGAGIWLVRLPVALLLGLVLDWGLVGAWCGSVLDISLRGVFNWLRFRSGRWKTMKV